MRTAVFILIACVYAAAAGDDKAKLQTLELSLNDAPLVPYQALGRLGPKVRAWNPFKIPILKNVCTCETTKCKCCSPLPGMEANGCFTATYKPTNGERKLDIVLSIGKIPVIMQSYPLEGMHSYNGTLPAPLSIISYDLSTSFTPAENGSVDACTYLDLRIGKSLGAVMDLKCFNINEQGLSSVVAKKPAVPDQPKPAEPATDEKKPAAPSADETKPAEPSTDEKKPEEPSTDEEAPSVMVKKPFLAYLNTAL